MQSMLLFMESTSKNKSGERSDRSKSTENVLEFGSSAFSTLAPWRSGSAAGNDQLIANRSTDRNYTWRDFKARLVFCSLIIRDYRRRSCVFGPKWPIKYRLLSRNNFFTALIAPFEREMCAIETFDGKKWIFMFPVGRLAVNLNIFCLRWLLWFINFSHGKPAPDDWTWRQRCRQLALGREEDERISRNQTILNILVEPFEATRSSEKG